MSFERIQVGGVGFYKVVGWDGAIGLFTTRHGGESAPPFDSMNLGAGSGDDPEVVARNRRILADALGLGARGVRTVSQVHGTEIYVLTDPDAPRPITGHDAIMTDIPGAAVGVLTADCVPIILHDPASRAVSCVHAGWAGTVKGIVGAAINRMSEVYGAEPSGIRAAIGPSIGPCCYEVDDKVIGPLSESHAGWEGYAKPASPGKWMLDLWAANRAQVVGAGVPPANVSTLGLCSACHQGEFFSHRRSGGRAGRMMAVAMIK